MYQGKYVLALIPARGGSKRLPRKNVLPLAGQPLIAWSIRAALAARYVDAVVVSTDDEEIAAVALAHGAQVHRRPAALAADDTTSLPVFVDALLAHQPAADIVLALQPTSPFRTAAQLDEAVQALVDQSADALIGVSKAKLGPEWQLALVDGLLVMPSAEALVRIRTQDQPLRYVPNGHMYAYTRATLLEAERYAFGRRTLPFVVDAPYDLDIDDITDFKLASAIAHAFDLHCP
jgi:CMP-N,N'-diacetyllegionaminic acid synthase